MSKPKIRIIDNQFAHTPNASFGCGDLLTPCSRFDWDRSGEQVGNDVVVLTETSFPLVSLQPEKIKVGLILESPLLTRHLYEKIKKLEEYSRFDYILTYSRELWDVDKRFIPYTFGGAWIKDKDRRVYDKAKNVSIIASFKKNTEWQQLRHDAISRFGDKIDGVYGNGYNRIDYKLEALRDYRYSIVTENDVTNDFFTEKINDCFLVGTIPIYCGTDFIDEYFNTDGILQFRTIQELEYCLSIANEELYFNSMEAINDNFNRALEYAIPEDRMYQKFFKPILGI
jgi:hypothetical protein